MKNLTHNKPTMKGKSKRQRERRREQGLYPGNRYNYKHGETHPVLLWSYLIWVNMKQRARRLELEVYEPWLDRTKGYINFRRDMGVRPPNAYSFARIDLEEGFFPGNMTWKFYRCGICKGCRRNRHCIRKHNV